MSSTFYNPWSATTQPDYVHSPASQAAVDRDLAAQFPSLSADVEAQFQLLNSSDNDPSSEASAPSWDASAFNVSRE